MIIHPKTAVIVLLSIVFFLLAFAAAVEHLEPGPRPVTTNPKISVIKVQSHHAISTARLRP